VTLANVELLERLLALDHERVAASQEEVAAALQGRLLRLVE
jgi:hypothetical protein